MTESQKSDALVVLLVQVLAQVQQSYEALINRCIVQARVKLANQLLWRDRHAVDVVLVEQVRLPGETKNQNRSNSKKRVANAVNSLNSKGPKSELGAFRAKLAADKGGLSLPVV